MNAERVDYVQGGQTLRLQRGRIQIYLHLALLPTIRIGHRRARDGDELRPNKIQTVVIEFLL